ncbi:MAG: DUF429 domain-containing protein [Nitrospinota bacterium]
MRQSFVGVDLSGAEKRPSGFCLLQGRRAKTRLLFADEELTCSLPSSPTVIVVDAPLFLPRGRCCLREDCACRKGREAHFRACDRALRGLGIRFFPITLGPMRRLTLRGLALRARWESLGHRVLEGFPGGAQDVWKMPRQKDPKGLLRALRKLGLLNGGRAERTVHELDAICCALVARQAHQGRAQALGEPGEGFLYLPEAGGPPFR